MSGRSHIVTSPSWRAIFWSSKGPFSTYSFVCASRRRSHANPAAVSPVALRPRGTPEPTVRLWIRPLRAHAVVHLLRPHVEPAHVHGRVQLLETALEQREQISAMRRIDDERRAAVAPAGNGEQ